MKMKCIHCSYVSTHSGFPKPSRKDQAERKRTLPRANSVPSLESTNVSFNKSHASKPNSTSFSFQSSISSSSRSNDSRSIPSLSDPKKLPGTVPFHPSQATSSSSSRKRRKQGKNAKKDALQKLLKNQTVANPSSEFDLSSFLKPL